jgi:hypothetical protein
MFGAGGPELTGSACPRATALPKKDSIKMATIFIFLTI